MAIESSNPVSIPSGGDRVAATLIISPVFTSAGVTGTAQLIVQHFRSNDDGTDPVPVGPKSVVNVPDIFAGAQTDPALASAVSAIEAAIQAYVTAKNL